MYFKLGGQIAVWGQSAPSGWDRVLTDLSKPGLAIAHPAHTSPTSLFKTFKRLKSNDECFSVSTTI